MNDLELLARFTDVVPHGPVPAKAERLLHAAIDAEAGRAQPRSGPGRAARARHRLGYRPVPRPAGRLVMAAGLSLAVAAGAVAAVALSAGEDHRPGAGHPTAHAPAQRPLTATELAYRAAAAAQHRAAMSTRQWLFTTETIVGIGGPGQRSIAFWRSAGAAYQRTTCYRYKHVVWYPTTPQHPIRYPCMQPVINLAQLSHGHLLRWQYSILSAWQLLRPFRSGLPTSLPADPHALLAYLGTHTRAFGDVMFQPVAPSGPSPAFPVKLTTPEAQFESIAWMLNTYVMSPRLTAELYQAVSDIPGVRIDQAARDVAGRPGVAFTISRGPSHRFAPTAGAQLAIILDPHSYAFDGVTWLIPHSPVSGVAITRQVAVSGPGVLP
jgi:hypothetical protein